MRYFSKNGQSLPLNTIVIAILVIIVLLVIILFFTSNMGKSSDQIENNNIGACSISNPAISSLGYIHAEYSTASDPTKECAHKAFDVLKIIPKGSNGEVCCVTKTPNTWRNNN